MAERQFRFDPHCASLIMRFPANWTAIVFFATLSCLHFANALPAVLRGHWEGELSLLLGVGFAAVTSIFCLLRFELAIRPSIGDMRMSARLGRIWSERRIPFEEVQAVRLYVDGPAPSAESRIEIVCNDESIECPPTPVPRQQALCLAMAMGVELVKVCGAAEDGSEIPTDGLPQK